MALALGANSFGAVIYDEQITGNNTNGNPVDVRIMFDLTGTVLTLTAENLLASPTSVAQVITGVKFMYQGYAGTPTYSNANSNGSEITVNSNGTTTAGLANVDMNWVQYNTVNGAIVCLICQGLGSDAPGQKEHGIIGPGPFTSSGGSIAGNGPHNPFIDQTGTFVFNLPGVTNTFALTGVSVYFNTTSGTSITQSCGGPCLPPNEQVVPEPSTYGLLAAGLIGMRFAIRRRNKK